MGSLLRRSRGGGGFHHHLAALFFFIQWCFIECAESSIGYDGEASAVTTQQQVVPCGIWQAPSTLDSMETLKNGKKRVTKLGLYAGQDYETGSLLQLDGAIPVVVVDKQLRMEDVIPQHDTLLQKGVALHMQGEGKRQPVYGIALGFGAMTALTDNDSSNVKAWKRNQNHPAGLDRTVDPGAGAFSTYHDQTYKTERPVRAGQEFLMHASVHPNRFKTQAATTTTTTSRSLDWLQHHGVCADHLKRAPSTLPQAGHGAFATRDLPAGTVVALLPLLHVPNGKQQLRVKGGKPSLLMNYCFGHGESSMLLCPYGPMASYVNHNQTLSNLHVRWTEREDVPHVQDAFTWSPSRFVHETAHSRLVLEMVATRDIRQGEEMFMDYGTAWEEAWTRHVQQWEPPRRRRRRRRQAAASEEEEEEAYMGAWQVNENTKSSSSRLLTEFEKLADPKHPQAQSVNLYCYRDILEPDESWRRNAAEGGRSLEDYLRLQDETLVPCDILSYRQVDQDDGSSFYLYTVAVQQEASDDDDDDDDINLTPLRIQDVPRDMFVFLDKPYTSDMFLPNAFRHEIRLPDQMFPLSWRNLK